MAETDYGKLERTIVKYAWFLSAMTSYAKECGYSDPVARIRKVADLQPEELAEQAEGWYAVGVFYASISDSARKRVEDLDEIWRSDTAEEFDEYFEALYKHIDEDSRNLSGLAGDTATTLRETAKVLLAWQDKVAETISAHAKEWKAAVDRSWAEGAGILSTDPLSVFANAAKAFWWGIDGLEKDFEYRAREGAILAEAGVLFAPMDSQNLREIFFNREPAKEVGSRA